MSSFSFPDDDEEASVLATQDLEISAAEPEDALRGPEPEELLERDKFYYFADVIFVVEGCLFKLPRAPFERNSEVF